MDGNITRLSLAGNFNYRLENYLRLGNRQGRTLFQEVPPQLQEKEDATNLALSQSHIALLQDYSGYSTLFRYDSRARFVNGVANAVQTEKKLQGESSESTSVG